MNRLLSRRFKLLAAAAGVLAVGNLAGAADPPSVKLALSFKPVQQDVEIETPAAGEYDQCQVKVERRGKSSGWAVFGPSGQLLRRYSDTNGDNVVDQWQYYQNGLEVYRDVDGNFNNKVDQSRWLNMAGSRWGIDENEDGRIDRWKVISAEEASREVVRAMVAGDADALGALLVDAADLKTLKLNQRLAAKMLEAVGNPKQKMKRAAAGSKLLTNKTRWMRFDSQMPSTIPADEEVAGRDLTVYENAMAIVQTGGKSGLLQLGEMVRVDEAWKLTQIPRPLEGNSIEVTIGGLLMQPALAGNSGPTPGEITPEVRELLMKLQALDKDSPSPSAAAEELTKYNVKRADLLQELADAAATDDEREQWTRQMVDGIAAAVQTGAYPKGIEQLQATLETVGKKSPKSPLVAYVAYRHMLAEFSLEMQQTPASKRPDVQQRWLKRLEKFTAAYPKAEDAPDAMLQLAIAGEFAGNAKAARAWYDRLLRDYPKSDPAIRAAGAVRRLELVGKPFRFSGSGLKGGSIDTADYRGKVVLVLFWSTWCKPCTEDLPQLRELYKQHRGQGFEIVGINLDSATEPIAGYLQQHKVNWPQIHEPGGLEGRPARQFGIVTLPTMFLIDRRGTTAASNVSIDDLKMQIPKMLK